MYALNEQQRHLSPAVERWALNPVHAAVTTAAPRAREIDPDTLERRRTVRGLCEHRRAAAGGSSPCRELRGARAIVWAVGGPGQLRALMED